MTHLSVANGWNMMWAWQRLWAYTDSLIHVQAHVTHTLRLHIRILVQLRWLLRFWNSLYNSQCLQLEILCLTGASITYLEIWHTWPDMHYSKWWRVMLPQSMLYNYSLLQLKTKNKSSWHFYMYIRDHWHTCHIKAKVRWTTTLLRHPCCSVHIVSVCRFSASPFYLWECNNGSTTPGINIQNLIGCCSM